MTDQDTVPDVDLEGLERLARAATAGPWTYNDGEVVAPYSYEGQQVADCIASGIATGRTDAPDGDFIAAANPTTVLTLITLAKRALSAAPLSQAPAGQGVGVEERVLRLAQLVSDAYSEGWAKGVRVANTIPREPYGWPESNSRGVLCGLLADHLAAMQAADAAQPTQDDAKRLREALEAIGSRIRERRPRHEATRDSVLLDIVDHALTPTSKTGDTDHAPEQ